jgi:hypothetical protein
MVLAQVPRVRTYLRAGSGIHRKEEPRLTFRQLVIQIHPGNRRLDDDIHVLFVELQDLVHEGEIDGHTSVRSGEVAFETGAPGIGDDGYSILVADLGDLRDFGRGLGIGYCDGETVNVGRGPFRVAMNFQIFRIGGDGVFLSYCLTDFLDGLG